MANHPMSIERTTEYGKNRCRNCGAFVTHDFVRVFGTNENEVFGCLNCLPATAVENGRTRHGASTMKGR